MTVENGLPAPEFFSEKGYPAEYGSKCSPWDVEDASCQEGGANFGIDWCTNNWCYVSAECTNAYETVFFADTEYSSTLKFSTETCKADEASGDTAPIVTITTQIKMEGDYNDFDQEKFKSEMELSLGVEGITIVNTYSGSIIVVFEVTSDKITLSELVSKFVNGEIKLSYPILQSYSETPDESIRVIKDGKLTYAAMSRAEEYEQDMKANVILIILGLAVLLMLMFGVFICLRQSVMLEEYKKKHVPLETVESARTNKADDEK